MLDFSIRLATKAGDYLKDNLEGEITIEHKGRIDLVTNMDRLSQERIVSEIERAYPDHGILAEEGFSKKGTSAFTWVIDPIDGTNNFIHRIPFFCVAVAVLKDGEPLVGVCRNPVSDETFWAQAGRGAFKNGAPIRVSQTRRMIDSLIATGFPYDHDDMASLLGRFERVLRKARGIRRMGSAALDLCMVASGSLDGFWEQGLKPWDMAAGVVILREAGGAVTCLDGSPFDLERGDIVASNARVHEELQGCMRDDR
ncbi:MAG TPA: inositol monophosphatase family protein [Deltaproteobacteria bacterium]|nr:inositol monophosphatase family protein [Deltaproteobacteria bacterium]HQI81530.1 inositol monophosphatase family protein [Deltaproteobacteria bacterium]